MELRGEYGVSEVNIYKRGKRLYFYGEESNDYEGISRPTE